MPDSSEFLGSTENASIKWHALRGVDLAQLQSALESGLPQSYKDTQGGCAIPSVSRLPAAEHCLDGQSVWAKHCRRTHQAA